MCNTKLNIKLKKFKPCEIQGSIFNLSYLSAQFFGNTFWAGKRGYFTLVILLAVFKRHNW